ncbi:thiolase family protein [Janibacter sp. G1551]|uniref:thiolase family protein n=1 Tax=Janibacter sp. G1551 TaxID=3420440 RepID=UPI003D047C4D
MPEAVIVSAVRTAIGTARKGTLSETPAEELATHILREAVARAGVAAEKVDDVIFAEAMYGGGDLARYAAVAAGMTHVAGQAVNRHCAGSLTTVGNAAGSIRAGMDRIIVAGGVQSSSLSPRTSWRVPGTEDEWVDRMSPTFPYSEDATDDVTLTVGWNVAQHAGISREEMDAWAVRSHHRAAAAIAAGTFADEISPIKVTTKDGATVDFAVDEHPRATSSVEKLATLKPLHPEIEGFSITAGNASGVNDAAAALVIASDEAAREEGLVPLGTVRAWAAAGVQPRLTGMGAIDAARKVLERAGLTAADIDLWEINEAFASVPVAAVKLMGLDEDRVNIYGSGCSLGHPVAASGARMLTTITHELRRRGGGLGIATMCAGGGQGGAVLIEVV